LVGCPGRSRGVSGADPGFGRESARTRGRASSLRPHPNGPDVRTWSGFFSRTWATPSSAPRALPISTRWPIGAAWRRTIWRSPTPVCRTTSHSPRVPPTASPMTLNPPRTPWPGRVSFLELDGNWRRLVQSMPTACDHVTSGSYAARHNPAVYYVNLAATCRSDDIALTSSLGSQR
jgi:hypothetical protein